MTEQERKVGTVTQYVANRLAAKVRLCGTLRIGDYIRIKGPRSDWKQQVEFLCIDQEPVCKAEAGQTVWLGVIMRAHEGDKVFLLEDENGNGNGNGDGPDGPDGPGNGGLPNGPVPTVPRGPKPVSPPTKLRPKEEKGRGMGG